MALAIRIRATIKEDEPKDIALISRGLTLEDKTLMRTHRLTETKKLIELHSKLFSIIGRKVNRKGPTPEENISTVKEIRKKSKFGK